MNNIKIIDIGSDFSKKPFGRYREDGKFSGSRFRDEILIPALDAHEKVEIYLDGVISFGSSFLEESFGGTVRTGKYTSEELRLSLIHI